MDGKNIFQLYFDSGKKCPFVVRRETWHSAFGLLVVQVRPRRTKSGWYGDAFGFGLPPLNGAKPNDYFGLPGNAQPITCAGCYQWFLIQNIDVPPQWQSYLTGEKI